MCIILAVGFRENNNLKGLTIGNVQYLINQYADDTLLFLDDNEENLGRALKQFVCTVQCQCAISRVFGVEQNRSTK